VRTWSDRPFPAEVPASDVDVRSAVIAENRGESSVIYEIGGHQGWLAKRYKRSLSSERQQAIDEIITLPGKMTDHDRGIVDETVAWPVARITEGPETVGVILAKAPDQFFYDANVTGGRTRRIAVTVDHLAASDELYRRLGMPPPTLGDRLAIVHELVTVGDLLERRGLVYGDWSYSNAFWSPASHRAFVIDVDSCGFGSRVWVESNAWDDPLVQSGSVLTTYTDRYKLILLATRCLTGSRGRGPEALAALPPAIRGSALDQVLRQGLTASTLAARPSMPDLLRALAETTTSAGVKGRTEAAATRTQKTASRSPRTTAATSRLSASARPSGTGSGDPRAGDMPDPKANVTGWRTVGAPPQPGQQPRRPADTRPAGHPPAKRAGRAAAQPNTHPTAVRRSRARTAAVVASVLVCLLLLALIIYAVG
jgi:hypothetical protein